MPPLLTLVAHPLTLDPLAPALLRGVMVGSHLDPVPHHPAQALLQAGAVMATTQESARDQEAMEALDPGPSLLREVAVLGLVQGLGPTGARVTTMVKMLPIVVMSSTRLA